MIAMRGRNGRFELHRVDVLPAGPERTKAGIYFYSGKKCRQAPSYLYGDDAALVNLLEQMIDALREEGGTSIVVNQEAA